MNSDELVIRRFVESDAEGVTALFREVYGDTYAIQWVYDPSEIARLNAEGTMISFLASAGTRIAGHVSMSFTPSMGIPERGHSVVSPAFQGMGIFGRILSFMHSTARAMGIKGLYNEAVTNHAYSQKASHSAGARECGLQLNFVPGGMDFGIVKHSDSRVTITTYYANLEDGAESRVFVPSNHGEIIGKIYSNLGIALMPQTASELPSADETVLNPAIPFSGILLITVHRCGRDFPEALRKALYDFKDGSISVCVIDLPLGDSGVLEAVKAAEDLGFIFSGVIPRYFSKDDCLRLQKLSDESTVNWDELVLATDFIKTIASHVRKQLEKRGS